MTKAPIRRQIRSAEASLGQALSAHQDARSELQRVEQARTDLHTRLGQGDATVTAADIAAADAADRRAELLEQAAADAIEPAKARVAAADLATTIQAAAAYARTGPDDEVREANRAAQEAQRHADELAAHLHRRIREIGHDLRARGAARVQPGGDETGWVGTPMNPEGFNIAGGPCLTTWDSLR
jgi:hypothetical protein